MPFAIAPRRRVVGTGRACRAVVAAGRLRPGSEHAAYRALQDGWFGSTLLLDEDAEITRALAGVPDLDADAVVAAIDDPETEAAYAAGHREARRAAGSPAEAQDRTAQTDGPVRYTAPSLFFAVYGRRFEAGDCQPLEVYDLLLATLAPRLRRAAPATDCLALLRAMPHGLTTREVSACRAPRDEPPEDRAAETELLDLLAAGAVRCTPLANGTTWKPA